jgi:hypothetical protein
MGFWILGFSAVIAELGPAIPIREAMCPPKRDGRDTPGHDDSGIRSPRIHGNRQNAPGDYAAIIVRPS